MEKMLGIPEVYDSLACEKVLADEVLKKPDNEISSLRSRIRSERNAGSNRYRCAFCRDPIYVSNSHGTPHFAHYSDSGKNCFWKTLTPKDLDAISASRFRGRQVSALHVRLILSLEYICRNFEGFDNTAAPDTVYFNRENSSHRFPDLQTEYHGRRYVFELQLSQTYLPVVADREDFYRKDGTVLIWLSNQFDLKKARQTERDILAVRSLQILEISEATIVQSLRDKTLYFDAHYQKRNFIQSPEVWEWNTKRVKFSDLIFDEYLLELRMFDPWIDETEMLRRIHEEIVNKFEKYWKDKKLWNNKLHERWRSNQLAGKPFEPHYTPEAVKIRAVETLLRVLQSSVSAQSAFENLGLELVIDALFAIKTGENSRNKQGVVGIFATALESRPHFTDALFAVAFAYGNDQVLKSTKLVSKAKRNLAGEQGALSTPQSHEFDRFFALLFPKAASYVRASALPYLLNLSCRA